MSGFKKRLTLFDSTMIVMGSMIGSGIFIVSADMARILGSPGFLMLAWAITGITTLMAAVTFGELAAMMPQAGGQYNYLREAYNPLTGFLYGWTFFTVIQSGTIAAIAMAFAKFSGVLFSWISADNVLLDAGVIKINTLHIIAIATILLLTWINARGIEEGKKVQNVFTFSKIIILVAFILIGLLFSQNELVFSKNNERFWQFTNSSLLPLTGNFNILVAMGTALVGSLFAADAWYSIAFASSEVRRPRYTIPMSMFLGVLIVSTIYMFINYVYLKALPLQGLPNGSDIYSRGIQYASEDRVGTAAMESIMGRKAEIIMAIIVMISTFGCNNGIILSGARVLYAMATDGLFFKRMGKLNSRRVPALALWVQSAWGIVLCLTGSFSQLLDYVIFAVLLFNALTIGAVFRLRIKKPATKRPYTAFGYPLMPLLYIAFCIFIMMVLLICKPLYTWPGLMLVLLGIPVYYFWKGSIKQL